MDIASRFREIVLCAALPFAIIKIPESLDPDQH
jgi:hypothetical protein